MERYGRATFLISILSYSTLAYRTRDSNQPNLDLISV